MTFRLWRCFFFNAYQNLSSLFHFRFIYVYFCHSSITWVSYSSFNLHRCIIGRGYISCHQKFELNPRNVEHPLFSDSERIWAKWLPIPLPKPEKLPKKVKESFKPAQFTPRIELNLNSAFSFRFLRTATYLQCRFYIDWASCEKGLPWESLWK